MAMTDRETDRSEAVPAIRAAKSLGLDYPEVATTQEAVAEYLHSLGIDLDEGPFDGLIEVFWTAVEREWRIEGTRARIVAIEDQTADPVVQSRDLVLDAARTILGLVNEGWSSGSVRRAIREHDRLLEAARSACAECGRVRGGDIHDVARFGHVGAHEFAINLGPTPGWNSPPHKPDDPYCKCDDCVDAWHEDNPATNPAAIREELDRARVVDVLRNLLDPPPADNAWWVRDAVRDARDLLTRLSETEVHDD